MREPYPSIFIENEHFYRIGCKVCETALFELYSNGKDFAACCRNCGHVQTIKVSNLKDKPEDNMEKKMKTCPQCGGTNFTVINKEEFCSTCSRQNQKDDGKVIVLDG